MNLDDNFFQEECDNQATPMLRNDINTMMSAMQSKSVEKKVITKSRIESWHQSGRLSLCMCFLIFIQLTMTGLIFAGALIARDELQSAQATVQKVDSLVPLVQDTLGPLGAFLDQIHVDDIGVIAEKLDPLLFDLQQLIALGHNITKMARHYQVTQQILSDEIEHNANRLNSDAIH